MHSRHAKISLNAAGGEDGEWLFLFLKVGRFWRGCAPKSDALLGETNWETRTGLSLTVQIS